MLWFSHDRYLDHVAGSGHPERPDRLRAVAHGVARSAYGEALDRREPTPATQAAIELVHPTGLYDAVETVGLAGGGRIDADTVMNDASFEAAMLAAGAGLNAIEALTAGEGDHAFCAVRPPGHHATASQSMGFCLFNSAAIAARTLTGGGERVAIVDIDAHHGNGTQDIFYADPDVLFVSLHQSPCYPGSGAVGETGTGDGVGTTLNVPMVPGTTGDAYRQAFDQVVLPKIESFAPTWLIISAGFDGHRNDPITDLGLTSGDYGDLLARLLPVVDNGRQIVFLEGGYDLEALADSTEAALSVLCDQTVTHPEAVTTGGPTNASIAAAMALHDLG